MKRVRYTLLAAVLVLALGSAGSAGTVAAQPTKYAQAGMPFLQINVGARAAALAGTQAGMVGDASAMFANPAGLAFVEGFDAMSSVTNWIADTKHYGAGVAYRLGNLGTFGAGIVWMDYGDFKMTEPYDGEDPILRNQGYVDLGTFQVNEFAVGLSYARQISSQFYVGGNVKYAKQDLPQTTINDELRNEEVLAENTLTNWVFDFGTMYYTGFRDLRFGMSIRNFSNQADYYDQRFELPLTFDFGVAMDLLTLMPSASGPASNSTLTLAADWLHPRDYAERLHVGLEYGFLDLVFLRGGYKFNYDEESFAAGVGVKAGVGDYGLKADYAYSAFGDFFGEVHRVTIGLYAK